jgi:hypothetical protein
MFRLFLKGSSLFFHPLLLPTWLVFFLLHTEEQAVEYSWQIRWLLILLTTIFTGALPMLSLSIMFFTKSISDIGLNNQQERPLTLLVISLYYLVFAYLLTHKVGIQNVVSSLALCFALLSCSATLLSPFGKISLHMLGMGGISGSLYALQRIFPTQPFIPLILVLLVLAGFVASERLYHGHGYGSVLLGYLLGFVLCTFGLLYLYQV